MEKKQKKNLVSKKASRMTFEQKRRKCKKTVPSPYLNECMEKLSVSSDSDSKAECPKCGLIYGESLDLL